MHLDIKIGPYKLTQRTEYSKIKVFDINKGKDVTDTIGKKIISDYKNQTNNPDKYFEIKEDNCLAELTKAVLYENIEYLFIPDTIESFGTGAVENGEFKYVKLPNSLSKISSYAFENCVNLKEIDIPDSVTNMEHGIFINCKNLTSVNFPKIKSIPSKSFNGCINLKQLIIPDSVKVLENYAFADCISLEKIYMPAYLEIVESSVFDGCEKLKKIDLAETLKEIHKEAFVNCGIEEITVPNNILELPDNVFTDCKNLKKVILPKNISAIGKEAFSDCTNLENIVLPDNLLYIGKSIFKNTQKLKNINIPKKLDYVNRNVFEGSKIKSLTFNHSLKCLKTPGDSLISESEINKLIISNKVKKIDNDAFVLDGEMITAIDYLGTKEEFEEFKNNNKDLFVSFLNLKKINFPKEKGSVKMLAAER